MPDEGLPRRTLRTTFWVAALFTLVFALRGQTTVALGLALGAAISMFSLWSLMVSVPRLFGSAAPAGRAAFGMLLALKLVLYAAVLAYAMSSPWFHPFAVFVGVGLVPAVLVLKVIGYRLASPGERPVGDGACRKSTDNSR